MRSKMESPSTRAKARQPWKLVLAATTLALAATASGGAAFAATGPGGELKLPESKTFVYSENARDYNGTTTPRLECVGDTACTMESDGTVGSVRLNTFAISSQGAHLWAAYGEDSIHDIGIFDAEGEQIETIENFDCQWQHWEDGQMLSCANTTPDFKIAVPAGGSFGMVDRLSVYLSQADVWAIGHDFADRNNPQSTVWDYVVAV